MLLRTTYFMIFDLRVDILKANQFIDLTSYIYNTPIPILAIKYSPMVIFITTWVSTVQNIGNHHRNLTEIYEYVRK